MSDLRIFSLTFEPEGVIVSYMDAETDVRVEGQVILQHQIRIHGAHPDYGDDIESLMHRASKLLKNALEDFASSDPWKPEDEEDPDDEKGMGE